MNVEEEGKMNVEAGKMNVEAGGLKMVRLTKQIKLFLPLIKQQSKQVEKNPHSISWTDYQLKRKKKKVQKMVGI